MLIRRDNPKGIHIAVQKLQSVLHTALLSAWGISEDAYHCHELCNRNPSLDGGYTAEVYNSTTGNYDEVYWDDALSAVSFFGMGPKITRRLQDEVPVHLVFFVDLKKLKPSIAHRADEEVRLDVLRAVGKDLHGFRYDGLELYLENVLREYPGTRASEGLKYIDMTPTHIFRLNYTLTFKQALIC